MVEDSHSDGTTNRGSLPAVSGGVAGRRVGLALALALAVAVALAVASEPAVDLRGLFGPASVGLGMAVAGDDALAELTAKIRAFRSGEDVDFETDRDDELGELYEAVEGLATAADERAADLQRQESLLDSIFEQVPVHLYVKDREARYLRVSSRYVEETYDRSDEMFLGKTDTEVFDGEFVEQFHEDDLSVVETGEPVLDKEEYVPVVEEWNLTSKVPWRGDDGEVKGLFGISQKITAQKQRERELRDANERLNAVVESSPDALIAVDDEGCVELWNPAAEEIFGWSESEVLGEPLPIVPDDEDVETFEAALAAGESVSGVETQRQRRDGSLVDVAISLAPMTDDDGAVVGAMSVIEDISERKEQARRLEALVENTDDIVYVKDREGRYQFANEACAALFDREPEAVVGSDDTDLFDEATAAEIRADDRRIVESGEPLTEEVTRPIDGEERVYLDEKFPYRDDDGAVVGLMGISRDITERKQAQRKLRQRERRLDEYREFTERILDAVDDVFYVLDEAGDLQRWNDSLPEVTGYDDATIESMNALEFFDETDRDDIAAAIDEAFETGEARVEAPYLAADGESIPYEFIASRVENPDGDPVVVGIGRDISERKERERQLRERERRLERYQEYTDDVLDAIDDVFYVLDEEGNLRRWNRSLERVTGYDGEDVAEMDALDFFVPEDREGVGRAIERVEGPGGTPTAARVLTSDGEVVPYEFVASPLEDPDGNRVVAGIGRDVSERKERERELRATKERLQKFIETSPVGIVATDPDGEVTLWNDAMADIFGWSAEEVLGEPYPAVPDDVDDEVRRRVLDGDRVTGVELERTTKAGDRIDISLSTAPVRDDDGDVTEVVGFIEDITERRERERELEARSAAMEGAIDGMAILDADGTYEFVNQAHAEVYGYDDPEAFLGESWRMCYGEQELRRMESEVLPALDAEGEWRGEGTGRRADGTTFPQELSLTVLDDGRMVCVVRDITERTEREREIERTRDMLQQAGRIASVGGWELDVSGDEPEMTWTDELYRLHGVDPGTAVDVETTVELYHPDDHPRIREYFRRAVESGIGYDMELRLRTDDDRQRWVRAIGEPVTEDGEVVGVRGSIQDITRQKERENALESLHEATRGLLTTGTDSEAAELVVDTSEAVLDIAGVAVYLLDGESNRLEAVASTAGFRELCEGAPPVGATDGDSLVWNAYVAGTPTVFDDTEAVADSRVFGPAVGGGLVVPIGDHGVFVVATEAATVDDETRQLVETLVATTEAAFDRIDSESTLRERDEELAAQNRRLRRQIQINDVIRRIDQSLIGATSREEIERAVCDRLVDVESVSFAWVGGLDATDELTPRAWDGAGEEYLESVSASGDGEGSAADAEPAAATAETEAPTVVPNVVDRLQSEPWAKRALSADFHSVVAVPLAYEEYFYGVLAVYADEPDAFGDLERAVFAELGESIAHSINAVETRRALHADTLVELSLEFDGVDDFFTRVAVAADCRLEYEGLATHSREESSVFVSAAADAETVADALDGLVSVREYRLLDDAEDRSLFEATVAGEVLPARLVRHGASPRSLSATAGGMEAVVDVPTATDVREFVEMLREAYPEVELTARRSVERATHSRQELVSSLFDGLTDRQLEVLRTAYFAGFFEWPRTSTGEDVAEMLDVTQPTVNRHLRLGQQCLLEQLFEEAQPAIEAD